MAGKACTLRPGCVALRPRRRLLDWGDAGLLVGLGLALALEVGAVTLGVRAIEAIVDRFVSTSVSPLMWALLIAAGVAVWFAAEIALKIVQWLVVATVVELGTLLADRGRRPYGGRRLH